MADPGNPPIASIPTEIWYNICERLYNSHPSSLRSLSLVNRRISDVATATLFRAVRLSENARDDETIAQDIEKWRCMLQSRDCLKHVRRIVVEHSDPPSNFSRIRDTHEDEETVQHPDTANVSRNRVWVPELTVDTAGPCSNGNSRA